MNEILDFVIIALLLVAIVYGFVLNRKIMLIKDSKKELANLFKSFDDTILKAQKGINDLKIVSSEVSDGLQKKIDRATILMDDIVFLNERSADILKNMEKKVSNFNPSRQQIAAPAENTITPDKVRNMKQAAAQSRELENKIFPIAKSGNVGGKSNVGRIKALEGLLEKLSEGKTPQTFEAVKPAKEKDKKRMVSDALKALGYGD